MFVTEPPSEIQKLRVLSPQIIVLFGLCLEFRWANQDDDRPEATHYIKSFTNRGPLPLSSPFLSGRALRHLAHGACRCVDDVMFDGRAKIMGETWHDEGW